MPTQACVHCNGTGRRGFSKCVACQGTGQIFIPDKQPTQTSSSFPWQIIPLLAIPLLFFLGWPLSGVSIFGLEFSPPEPTKAPEIHFPTTVSSTATALPIIFTPSISTSIPIPASQPALTVCPPSVCPPSFDPELVNGFIILGEPVFNVYDVNNKLGLNIPVNFTIQGLKGVRCNIGAYFSFIDGTLLKSRPGDTFYSTTKGEVYSGQDVIPLYDTAQFTEYFLFLPYESLNMAPGTHQLQFVIRLFNRQTDSFFAETTPYIFTYTQPVT